MSPLQVPRARIAPPRARWLAFAPGVAMTAWAATSARSIQGGGGTRGLCFGSLLLAACFLLGAARDRPIPRPSRLACQELDALTVVAIVPVFNEDPDALRNCLESLLAQTRPLEGIVRRRRRVRRGRLRGAQHPLRAPGRAAGDAGELGPG